MQKLIFIYEPGHIPLIEKGAIIVALDREVEYMLEEEGISYISAKDFRDPNPFERLVFADRYVHTLFKQSSWSFFAYRGVTLGALLAFPLQEFLLFLLYYTSIYKRLAEVYPQTEWHILPPTQPPPRAGGSLALHVYDAAVRAARIVTKQYHIPLVVSDQTAFSANTFSQHSYAVQRRIFGVVIGLVNTIVRATSRPKPIQLVVSDYWRHIAPFMQSLPGAEITLLDRSEIKHIPWKDIVRHRIRFVRLRTTKRVPKEGWLACERLARHWQEVQAALEPVLYDGVDVTSAVVEALDTLFLNAMPEVIGQIEGAYALLEQKPTAVLLRASVSGQPHFGALALVAEQLGIPGIELQHGLEYLGEGSLSRNHAAKFLAVYGPVIRRELLQNGYSNDRLIEIGSPRFDIYRKIKSNKEGTIVCIGPDVYAGGSLDTYDGEEFLKTFLGSVPKGLMPVIKLRANARETFFLRVIKQASVEELRVETTRPLPEVFKEARVVVSCFSTAVLESLQCGIPSIILSISALDKAAVHYHFDQYVSAEVLQFAESAEGLRSAFVELSDPFFYEQRHRSIQDYMSKEFLFDGRASGRLTDYIESLVG